MTRILIVWLWAATLAGLTGCGSSTDKQPPPGGKASVAVTVAMVERSTAPGREELMGTVVPRNRADIQSKVQAKVERIPVTLGSVVAAGELLAELDSRELEARVQQGRAVNQQTATELKRFDSLFSRKLISQQEYDVVKTRADIAKASLAEAEAMRSYARIEAPFAGRVTQKTINIGDLAVPGKPLFVLEEDAALRFEVGIPESRRSFIALGDTLLILIDPTGAQISGKVIEISPSADAASRSYLTKLEIPRADGIRGGQFGRLLLPAPADGGLLIPSSALIKRGQLEIVFVISADRHAEARLVRSGRRMADRIEILAGLSDGEQVAVSGATLLSQGDSVEIRP
jgi:RND family efflux transporter MFP subunit